MLHFQFLLNLASHNFAFKLGRLCTPYCTFHNPFKKRETIEEKLRLFKITKKKVASFLKGREKKEGNEFFFSRNLSKCLG